MHRLLDEPKWLINMECKKFSRLDRRVINSDLSSRSLASSSFKMMVNLPKLVSQGCRLKDTTSRRSLPKTNKM